MDDKRVVRAKGKVIKRDEKGTTIAVSNEEGMDSDGVLGLLMSLLNKPEGEEMIARKCRKDS